jgi:hypothetical protein
MIFHDLVPPVPVFVPSTGRSGVAQWVIHYGPEHHPYWGVVYDDTGEVWWHPIQRSVCSGTDPSDDDPLDICLFTPTSSASMMKTKMTSCFASIL